MTTRALCTSPPSNLAEALARFEAQFRYPLGPGRSFRISHGDDYPRFFRAMGEAASFVSLEKEEVMGTLGAALRPLLRPDGSESVSAYLGDLKIAAAARGGMTLVRLIRAAMQWVGDRAAAGFSVVMDGTPVTPQQYTGRIGVPAFEELCKIAVLRVSTPANATGIELCPTAGPEQVDACYRRLSAGRFACPGGNAEERSETAPLWLLAQDGCACGRLEDTRRAKRLIDDAGDEMRSAHLSCFAYRDPRDGVKLLMAALRFAGTRGFPALFAAVPAPEAQLFHEALAGTSIVIAPATVYGVGAAPGPLWNVNTAEI